MSPLPFPVRSRNLALCSVWALAVAATTGCTSVAPNSSFNSLFGQKPNAQSAATTAPPATCQVDLKRRRTKTLELPLTAETRVQDVLVESKAIRSFRRPLVTVYRKTGHPSEPTLKLVSNFNHKTDKVTLDTDYAILPGDRVVIEENPMNSVEEMLGSLMGR